MSTGRFLLLVLVSFACTFFLRALPFLAFSGERKMPAWLDRLGHALPPAIMAVLVVYCLKSVTPFAGSRGAPEAIALLVTVALHKWKHETLLSVAGGTLCYVLLVQLVF